MTSPSAAVGQEPELLPCPFCGEVFHLTIRPEGSMTPDMPARPYRVVCHHLDHDDVEGPVGYGRAGAAEAWNRRPLNAAAEYGEPVAWRYQHKEPTAEELRRGHPWHISFHDVTITAKDLGVEIGVVEPLYSATALSALVAERDEARAQRDDADSDADKARTELGAACMDLAASEARNAELVEDAGKLAEFFRMVLTTGSWIGADIDGGVAQDTAERLGLIIAEPFDPAKHGDHPDFSAGDTWFAISPRIAALQSQEPRNG